MTSTGESDGRMVLDDLLVDLPDDATHADVDASLRGAGWEPCGVGDWAWALRAPDGRSVARIAPFDPAAPYAAELYRVAAVTGQVPVLLGHRELAGARGAREQPWWGPLDDNPANVMRRGDGRLVLTDPSYADGPRLYRAVVEDPDRVVRAYPPERRRHMTELPLASSGAWDAEEAESMRAGLAAADARLAGSAAH